MNLTLHLGILSLNTDSSYLIPSIPQWHSFRGSGQINNLNIIATDYSQNGLGLFGGISLEGEVNNIGLENVYVSGKSGTYATLAAHNLGKITNCFSNGTIIREVNTSDVGGLVGVNGGKISNCYSEGLIITDINYPDFQPEYSGVGGLVGFFSGGCIEKCYSTVNIFNAIVPPTMEGTGGLVGFVGDGIIRKCFSEGLVNGYDYVGGLVGLGAGGITTQSFSIGSVTGRDYVGGLVGNGYYNIENCYSTGNVYGRFNVGGLGGLAGANNCHSSGSVTGMNYVGGLIGQGSATNSYFLNTSGPDNGIGTPLSDSEMRQCVSFNSWDFAMAWPGNCELGPDYVWCIFDGVTYPDLAWHQGICTVPNVVGLNMTDANDKIIDRGFTGGNIIYEHNEITEPVVIHQNPAPDTQPACGSPVNYVVSLGPWPCIIPDVVGMKMSDANMLIEDCGHRVGTISYSYNNTIPKGYIINQSPNPGPSECGLVINYVASLGTLPDNGKFPDYDSNGIVNFIDFALFANAWLMINPTINLTIGDNYINIIDLKIFSNSWLKEQ